jgi:hypothetical protein
MELGHENHAGKMTAKSAVSRTFEKYFICLKAADTVLAKQKKPDLYHLL